MEKSMAKARTKSNISQTSSETVTDAAKASDAQRKTAEQGVLTRHVEGLRTKMASMGGEDMSPMTDAGFQTKGLPTMGRTHREHLLAQMKKAGVDVTRPTPGISRENPLTQLRIDPKTNKPFMTRAKPKKTLRGLLKRVFSNVGGVLAGSHLNVAPTRPTVSPSAYGGMIRPPRTRQGPSPK
jgi:hypothetical protein